VAERFSLAQYVGIVKNRSDMTPVTQADLDAVKKTVAELAKRVDTVVADRWKPRSTAGKDACRYG